MCLPTRASNSAAIDSSSALVRAQRLAQLSKKVTARGAASTLQTVHKSTKFTMAKDRSEKKEKKEKRKSVDGVKKEKKDKKERKSIDATTALAADDETMVDATEVSVVDQDGDEAVAEVPVGALVPFANPLCDDKAGKKVLKTVKKGMQKISPIFALPRLLTDT